MEPITLHLKFLFLNSQYKWKCVTSLCFKNSAFPGKHFPGIRRACPVHSKAPSSDAFFSLCSVASLGHPTAWEGAGASLEDTARNQERSRGSFQAARRLCSIRSPKCRRLMQTQAPQESESLSLIPGEGGRKTRRANPKTGARQRRDRQRERDVESLPS